MGGQPACIRNLRVHALTFSDSSPLRVSVANSDPSRQRPKLAAVQPSPAEPLGTSTAGTERPRVGDSLAKGGDTTPAVSVARVSRLVMTVSSRVASAHPVR